MSLFTLIKYPVTKDTTDFRHVPDEIWDVYMGLRRKMTAEERKYEDYNNKLIIQLMLDWEDPET